MERVRDLGAPAILGRVLETRMTLGRHLLCAVPQLRDPNFERSVVLMLQHATEGALGLVINNPLPTKLAEVAPGLELTWHGAPDERVRLGGPVEPMRGWILHDQAMWDPTAEEVLRGVYLTTSLEPVTRAGRTSIGRFGTRFIFILGYAGWAPSQLEGEVAAGSWVPVPIDHEGTGVGVAPDWLFCTDPTAMWDEAMRSIGVDPARMVRRPGNAATA
jgi:putative transcriptional regulator